MWRRACSLLMVILAVGLVLKVGAGRTPDGQLTA
jgi:hypothetical protein